MNIFQQVITLYRELKNEIPPIHINEKCDQVVIIDPGHGGLLNGRYTTAPDKMAIHDDFTFWEGVWTRAVAWSFAMELRTAQRNYVILVPGDKDIYLSQRLALIREIVKSLPKTKKFYVNSIHGNAFGVEAVRGVEVFTSPGETVSDPLAHVYFDELKELKWKMRPGNGLGNPDKEARFAMLTGPEAIGVPAILTETGFYTNREQAAEMCEIRTIAKIANIMKNADVRIDYRGLLY